MKICQNNFVLLRFFLLISIIFCFNTNSLGENNNMSQSEFSLMDEQQPLGERVILIIIPNPSHHVGEIVAATNIYNEALLASYTPVLLIGSDGADNLNLKYMKLNSKKNIYSAIKANMIKYMKTTNLKGIYYFGDGTSTYLLTPEENEEFSHSDFKTNGINFNEEVTFIANACLAFNEPFGPAVMNEAKAKFFMSGITNAYDTAGSISTDDQSLSGILSSQVFIGILFKGYSFKEAFELAKGSQEWRNAFKKYTDNSNWLNTSTVWGFKGIDSMNIPNLTPNLFTISTEQISGTLSNTENFTFKIRWTKVVSDKVSYPATNYTLENWGLDGGSIATPKDLNLGIGTYSTFPLTKDINEITYTTYNWTTNNKNLIGVCFSNFYTGVTVYFMPEKIENDIVTEFMIVNKTPWWY